MNVFRLAGDVSHVVAIIVLFVKIWRSRSCAGRSGAGGGLWAWGVGSWFRLAGDVSHVVAIIVLFVKIWRSRSCAGLWAGCWVWCGVWGLGLGIGSGVLGMGLGSMGLGSMGLWHDTFRVEFLLIPVIGLSFLENYAFTPLEAVAIMPQLFMITNTGEAESITTHYLFFLGLYRALYLANWVWRYHTSSGFFDQIAVVSGVVQTFFYCDFFYLYITRVLRGSGKMGLPMPI
ncbi:hypothetical protein CRUP_036655 [Coryphaenoides rupestris]|nr:hypothetical protein CRUP_036655 [Coryphaenoides rupestris]